MRDSIGIRHFESSLLQVVAEIEFRSAHKKRALGVHHHAHLIRFDYDVPVCGSIHEVHLVLKSRAAASYHRHTESALGTALLGENRAQTVARRIQNPDEFFVTDSELDSFHR